MKTTPEDIGALLAGLSDEEKSKTLERLAHVQEEVKERVKNGDIASSEGDARVVEMLEELGRLAGRPTGGVLPNYKRGGPATFEAHEENNSYLGEQLSRKAVFGVVAPGSKGIVLK